MPKPDKEPPDAPSVRKQRKTLPPLPPGKRPKYDPRKGFGHGRKLTPVRPDAETRAKRRLLPVDQDPPPHVKKLKYKLPPPKRPWHRRVDWGESASSHELFILYRDMPVTVRAVKALARQLGRPQSTMIHFAHRYRWRKRCEAYYAWLAERAERIRRREVERLARDEVKLGRSLMTKSQQGVDILQQGQIPIDPAGVATLAKTGSDLRRRGLGLPKDHDPKAQVTVNTTTNTQVNVVEDIVKKLDEAKKTTTLTVV